MMKFVSETTREFGIPTIVSLNTIMIDGTGMCGGCRVVIDQEVKFVCMDGPDFNGHQVDWDNLISRLSFYRAEEKAALDHWLDHQCRLGLQPAIPEVEKATLAGNNLVKDISTQVHPHA
jgi:ferredoxin--NADP+ reductase